MHAALTLSDLNLVTIGIWVGGTLALYGGCLGVDKLLRRRKESRG